VLWGGTCRGNLNVTCEWVSEWVSEWVNECGSSPYGPDARRPWQAHCAPSLGPSHESPLFLKEFQIALRLRPLTSSGSKKRIPDRYAWVSPRLHTHTNTGWGFLPSPVTYLSKSAENNLPSRFPYGAPASRKMLHLQSPLYISLKVPRKDPPPSRFPRCHVWCSIYLKSTSMLWCGYCCALGSVCIRFITRNVSLNICLCIRFHPY
jgi:hypothetical protein